MRAGRFHYLKLLLLTAASFQAGISAAANSGIQSHAAIRDTARNFLIQQAENGAGGIEVEVNRLDNRLRLSACGEALEAFLPASGKKIGRVTVGIRCNDGKPWSLYLPARVKLFDQVVIANRKIMRGQTIQRADLKLVRQDVSRLHRGYFLDIERVAGKIPKRTIQRGKPLTPTLLKAPDAIVRGAQVSIIADIGGIQARMKGRALGSGSLGERIRVKNLSSNKELEARIISAGAVRVDI